MSRWLVLALAGAMASNASAQTVRGEIELNAVENYCNDSASCEAGRVCHLSIIIRGAAANTLLKVLRDKMASDKELSEGHNQWREMGLSIYFSKDENLGRELINAEPADDSRVPAIS